MKMASQKGFLLSFKIEFSTCLKRNNGRSSRVYKFQYSKSGIDCGLKT